MPTHLRVRSALLFASLLFVAASTAAAQAPLAPTMLYVGNDEAQTGSAGDPVLAVNHKPVFSAIFNHEDPNSVATEARVQIASDAEFTAVVATTAWRATGGAPGQRISDVEYRGNKLECGVRYWWRISIRDGASVASPWSVEAASFTTVLCPGEPTALYVGSYTAQSGEQGDPVAAISLKPFFSATATHEDPAGALVDAKVQFATDAEFATRIATTSWQAITPTTDGSRCPDVQYSGSPLPPETRVWWRIKFRDTAGTIGPWSTEAASFVTLPLPAPPTQLFVGNEDAQTGSQGDPVPAINLKPSFSALHQHAIPGETASKVRVQIASDAAFTSVVVTTSWKDALATPAGGRCPDVSYNGNALQCGSRYWWRIAFQDSFGNIGEWSTEPASFETVFCPHSPVQLQVGSIEAQTGTSGDPVENIILKPYFSAVSAHASPNALVTDAKLQFALDADFTQLIATTGWKAVNPAISGERCSDIKYTGNAFDGYTRIWWRIRFRDDAGTVGPWSEEAASFVTTPTPLPPTGLFVDAFDAQAGSMGNPVHFVDQTPHFSVVAHHQDTQALITALKVQIAVDPEFLGVVWTSAWKSISATTDGFRTEDVEYTGSALAANTTYYWRVRSRDATDQLSDWSTEAASFVTDHNSPPNLAPVGEATLTEGTPLTLTLQGSDPDPYTVLTYSASGLPAGASLNSSTGEFSWTPGFSQAGQYPVVFRVSDNNPFNPMFDEETGVFTVVDANGPPTITTASGDTQFSMAENSNLAIPLEVNDPDLSDGLSVQATLAGGLPLPAGARTVLSADGYRFEWDTNFEQAGTYQIVLTVTDNGTPPLATSLDITIEVHNVNRPPVMDAVAPVSAAEGQDTAIQLRAVDPDAADTLIYSASTPLPEGAVLVPETGLLTWTPTFEQAGHYEFTVSVTDTGSPALGDSRLVVIDVANTNRAPVIDHVGNYLIYEGAELVVSITVSDPDSEDLVSVAITMADGLPLPAGAGFVDGVLIWTPSFQQAGTYGLKIRAEDNHLPPETAEQLFSVTVVNVNRAPAFLNAANQSLNEGIPFSLQLHVADPDTWDSHVFSLEPGEGASLPAGLVLDTSTGLLSWTPTYAQAGSWPIRLTVTDSGEPPLSASESITLIVADVPHEVTMVGHFPEVNANGVAPTAVVDAAFSEPMAVPQSGQFTVSSNWRGSVPGAVTLDGNSIQFHPGGSYFAGELVGVSASSNLLSSLEASLSQPFMWQFRVSTATSEAGFSRQVAPFGSDSSEVRDVVVADFDNDGDLDFLVLATSPAAANYMYRNDGSGNMAAASIIGTGASGPAGIRALDYNGDGATDVLYWIGSVGYIYVNAGGMQFNLAGSVNLQPGLAEVEVGDMNADGRADLVTVTESGLVTVMKRASEGFVEAGTLDLGAGLLGTYRIELADIYANGGLEIVVANEALVQVLTYNSPLTVAQAFPHPTGALKDLDVADTNGDRYPDIYVTGESLWAFVADPNTGFGAGSFIDLNGTPVQDIDLGDVDGDGDLDMLVAFADYTLVMRNLGNGQLFDAHEAVGNAIGGEPSQLMRTFAVDMNGDRKLDVINLRAEGYGRTFFNTDRLRASIHDAEGVAPYTGERVVQVPVTLDFTPVNAVTVYYETVDEPPPPGGGDHDALPNPNDFTLAAAAPPGGAGYIPTSGLLTFQPGVRTQWISVTLTATAPVSGVLHISVRLTQVLGVPGLIQPGGALVLVQTGTISVAQPGALPSVPPQPAMSTDWRVEGPVNAITSSGQVSYLGGDFRAVSWARNQAASFDVTTGLPANHFSSGVHGSFTGPGGTGQPSIITVVDDGACVIVGGSFQYSEAGGGTYLSIVRLNKATGMADPKFNPSPMDGSSAGRVNAIVVQGVLVSYGGHFNSARSSPSSGWTTRSNLDRVQWNSSSGDYEGLPTGYIGQPSAANPEVFALLADGSKLLVGGEFGQAADAAGANAETVFNIALFDHTSTTATLAYNTSFVGVTLSGNHLSPDGSVRAFASNGSEIVVGGEFRYYGAYTATPIPQYTWADLQAGGSTRDNLLQINGLASFGSPVPLPFVGVGAVRSLQFFNSGTGTHPYHLFIGQVGSQSAPTVPSLLRGAWDGSGSLQNMGTALAVVDQLAISGTTLLAGTRGTAADFWATPSVRRYQLAAGPYFATLDALPNTGNAPLGALAVDGSGIALAFGGFTRFGVGRSNLAAFESTQGTLLDWRPRPTGPVYAVETTGQDVFFGGAFGTVNDFTGLGNLSASPVYGTAAPDTIRNWSGAYIRAGGPVYALAYDAGRQLIYVGGEFGTLNNDVRTSLGVINTLTGGVKNFWDPVVIKDLNGTFQPGRVNALALNADTIYVGGSFDYVNGDMRTDLAAVTAWDAANQADSHTSWAPPVVGGANRTVKALKIDAGAGRVYVGGDFARVSGFDRASFAALSLTNGLHVDHWNVGGGAAGSVNAIALAPNGDLFVGGEFNAFGGVANVSGLVRADRLTGVGDPLWVPSLLPAPNGLGGTSTSVRAIALDNQTATPVLRFAGVFEESSASPSALYLASLEQPLVIAPVQLLNATEGQSYQVQFNLSLGTTASWSIGAGATASLAPYLKLDPNTGLLVSIDPVSQLTAPLPLGIVPPGQVGHFALSITASVSGTLVSRQYTLTVTPAPTLSFVPNQAGSFPSRSEFVENDQAVQYIANGIALQLSSPAPAGGITVEVETTPITALAGRDFVLDSNYVTFNAGTTSAWLSITVFGDDVAGQTPRICILRLKRVVSGTASLAANSDVEIWILEDDLSGPRYSVANDVQVLNGALAPAEIDHVVAPSPLFTWRFFSDAVPTREQAGYEVEIFDDAQLSNLVVSEQVLTPDPRQFDQFWQCTILLAEGQAYWFRVTLRDSFGVLGTPVILPFKRNWAPSPLTTSMLVDPIGTITDGTPAFSFTASSDADGDALHYVMYIADGTGAFLYSLSSTDTEVQFEYESLAGGWFPLPSSGAPRGAVRIRGHLPTTLALQNGQYEWFVTVTDGYENSSFVGAPGVFVVSASYDFIGHVNLPSGGVDPSFNGTVQLTRIVDGSAIAQVTAVSGRFEFLGIAVPFDAGELLAFHTVGGSVGGSCVRQFWGSNMTGLASIDIETGTLLLEHTFGPSFQLGRLASPVWPAIQYGTDVGWDQTSPVSIVLNPVYQKVTFKGVIHADASETDFARVFRFSPNATQPTTLSIDTASSLLVDAANEIEVGVLQVEGEIAVVNGSSFTVLASSTLQGASIRVSANSTIQLNASSLVLHSCDVQLENSIVTASPATAAALWVVSPLRFEVAGAGFHDTRLIVTGFSDSVSVASVTFSGAPNSLGGGASTHLLWGATSNAGISTIAGAIFVHQPTSPAGNVEVFSGGEHLRLIDASGNGSGEAFDIDPDEGTGGNRISWELPAVEGLVVESGNTRARLTWTDCSCGAAFEYWVFRDSVPPTGSPSRVAVSTQASYIDTGLINGLTYEYYVVLGPSGGAVGQEIIETASEPRIAQPALPQLVLAEPSTLAIGTMTDFFLFASNTHWDANVDIQTSHSHVASPLGGVLTLSQWTLMLGLEAAAAASPGTVTITIAQFSIWGISGYDEIMQFDIELVRLHTAVPPRLEFDHTAGIGDNDRTTGAFDIVLTFHSEGGAPIEPDSLEVYASREINVSGVTVGTPGVASTLLPSDNLANPLYDLFQTSTSGGTAHVEQQPLQGLAQTPTVGIERYLPGRYELAARVQNRLGLWSPWASVQFHVEGYAAEVVILDGELEQGESTVLTFRGTGIPSVSAIDFPSSSGITVSGISPVGTTPVPGGTEDVWSATFTTSLDTPTAIDIVGIITNSTGNRELRAIVNRRLTKWYPYKPVTLNSSEVRSGIGVDVRSGEFVYSELDISTHGRAFPIYWTRSYRSSTEYFGRAGSLLTANGPLGSRWHANYLQRVWVVHSHNGVQHDVNTIQHVLWMDPTGRINTFKKDPRTGLWNHFLPEMSEKTVFADIYFDLNPSGDNISGNSLRIVTAESRTYRFKWWSPEGDFAAQGDQYYYYVLDTVTDGWGNQHECEYMPGTDLLKRVYGDIASLTTTQEGRRSGAGEYLELDYNESNQIDTITHKQFRPTQATASEAIPTLDASFKVRKITYSYSPAGELLVGASTLYDPAATAPASTRGYGYTTYTPQVGGLSTTLLTELYSGANCQLKTISTTILNKTYTGQVVDTSNSAPYLSQAYLASSGSTPPPAKVVSQSIAFHETTASLNWVTRTFDYDANYTDVEDAEGHLDRYHFDFSNNLLTAFERRPSTGPVLRTDYVRDTHGRITKESAPVGAGGSRRTIEYVYSGKIWISANDYSNVNFPDPPVTKNINLGMNVTAIGAASQGKSVVTVALKLSDWNTSGGPSFLELFSNDRASWQYPIDSFNDHDITVVGNPEGDGWSASGQGAKARLLHASEGEFSNARPSQTIVRPEGAQNAAEIQRTVIRYRVRTIGQATQVYAAESLSQNGVVTWSTHDADIEEKSTPTSASQRPHYRAVFTKARIVAIDKSGAETQGHAIYFSEERRDSFGRVTEETEMRRAINSSRTPQDDYETNESAGEVNAFGFDTLVTKYVYNDSATDISRGRLSETKLEMDDPTQVDGGQYNFVSKKRTYKTTVEYDPVTGFPNKVTDPRGHEDLAASSRNQVETLLFYDVRGRLQRVSHPPTADNLERPEELFYYDEADRVAAAITKYVSGNALNGHSSAPVSLPGNWATLSPTAVDSAYTLAQPGVSGWRVTKNRYSIAGVLLYSSFKDQLSTTTAPHQFTSADVETRYVYDSLGRLEQTSGSLGRTTRFAYDEYGRIKEILGPKPNELSEANASETLDDSLVTLETRTYDHNGNLLQRAVPLKSSQGGSDSAFYFYAYDGLSRLRLSAGPLNSKDKRTAVHHRYDDLRYQVTSARTDIHSLAVSDQAALASKLGTYLNALGESSTAQFRDGFGRTYKRLSLAEDSTGGALAGGVMAFGSHTWARHVINFQKYADPDMTIDSERYIVRGRSDELGRPALLAEGSNLSAKNAIVQVREGYNRSETIAENEGGSLRGATEILFDYAGKSTQVKDADGVLTTFQHNIDGLVSRVTESNGVVRCYEYDLAGRLVKSCVRSGAIEENVVRYVYDKGGRKIAECCFVGGVWNTTRFEYDRRDQLVKMTKPGGPTWRYEYDRGGRQIRTTYPNNHEVVREYSKAGELLSWQLVVNGSNATGTKEHGATKEEFTYDEFGRLTQVDTYWDDSKSPVLTLKWDEFNSLGLPHSQTLLAHTPDGELINVPFEEISAPFRDPAITGFKSKYDAAKSARSDWVISAGYRASGLRDSETFWDGRSVHREYDQGRLKRVYEPKAAGDSKDGDLASYQYFSWSRLDSRHLGLSGQRNPTYAVQTATGTGFGFTAADRVERIQVLRGGFGHAIENLLRKYGDDGRVIAVRSHTEAATGWTYTYDDHGRLAESYRGMNLGVPANPPGGTADEKFITSIPSVAAEPTSYGLGRSYNWDQLGNRTSIQDFLRGETVGTGAATEVLQYTADTSTAAGAETGRNLYEEVSSSRHPASQAGAKLGYEDNLDYLADDPTSGLKYEYDILGRLIRVKNDSTVVREVTYDYLGRKILDICGTSFGDRTYTLTVPDPAGPGGSLGPNAIAQLTFSFDGSNFIGEEVVHFTNALGTIGSGADSKRVCEFIAFRGAEASPFYRFLNEDPLGSTIFVTNQFGDRTAQYFYDDFGAPVWRPVAFDGHTSKHSGIQDIGAEFTRFILNDHYLKNGELVGKEIAVFRQRASDPKDHIRTALVTGNTTNSIQVFDPNDNIKSDFDLGSDWHYLVYDLAHGYTGGRIEGVTLGTLFGQTVTFIEDSSGAFFGVNAARPFLVPSLGKSYTVLSGWDHNSDGIVDLALLGDQRSDLASQIGTLWEMETIGYQLTQAGHVVGTPNGVQDAQGVVYKTEISLPPLSLASDAQVGWKFQPNVKELAFFDIIEVSVNGTTGATTIVVAGNSLPLHQAEARFRIFAPVGVDRQEFSEGAISKAPGSQSTHYLWAGYDYETPLAGFKQHAFPFLFTDGMDGWRVSEAYYLWNRRYDPGLGRFTTPDPARMPSFNLQGYALNDPINFYDPMGLEPTPAEKLAILEQRKRDNGIVRGGDFEEVYFGQRTAAIVSNTLAAANSTMTFGLAPGADATREGQRVQELEGAMLGFPDITLGLGKLGKLGKILRFGDEALGGARHLDEGGEIISSALRGTSGGADVGQASRITGRICFVAGTQVLVEGEVGRAVAKAIEDVKLGDRVWSRDELTGSEGFKPVITLFRTAPKELVHLTYKREPRGDSQSKRGSASLSCSDDDDDPADCTLIGTSEHPFWSVTRQQWVPMGELQLGERLRVVDGSLATVTSLWLETLDNTSDLSAVERGHFVTYNFEVADWHTYFAAPEEADSLLSFVWVHNQGLLCEEGVRKARAAYEARGARGEEFLATLYRKGDINDADLVAILGTPKSFRSFSAYSRTTLTHVYFGVQGGTKKYVGIAIDVGSRELQHGSRFQQLLPITRVAIPRSHARAIEQALILRHGHISRSGRVVGQGEFLNLINSIGPGREPLFQDAVEWGQKWLRITGN